MQLNPDYGPKPRITLDGPAAAVSEPAIRQRQRLTAAVTTFTDEQWAHPSRCEGWSNRDVIVHLDSTNSFWAFAITAGVQGAPTQFLATFDPVTSPAQLVAGARERSTQEVLASFVASTAALVDVWSALNDDTWSATAEAPPGHVSVSAVTHHALWDSWVHERDILLPLGLTPAEEADEIDACLRYAAALGPALARNRGDNRRGVLAIGTTRPNVSAVVEIAEQVTVRVGDDTAPAADLTLTGHSVALLEAFSIRGPFSQPILAEHRWMLAGLAETFDATEP